MDLVVNTAQVDEQLVQQLWNLFSYGSAQSIGWGGRDVPHEPGSGYIFAYGHLHIDGSKSAGVTIYNATDEQRTIDPATPENVLEALNEMGITETSWSI